VAQGLIPETQNQNLLNAKNNYFICIYTNILFMNIMYYWPYNIAFYDKIWITFPSHKKVAITLLGCVACRFRNGK